jgi:hypothetical protein
MDNQSQFNCHLAIKGCDTEPQLMLLCNSEYVLHGMCQLTRQVLIETLGELSGLRCNNLIGIFKMHVVLIYMSISFISGFKNSKMSGSRIIDFFQSHIEDSVSGARKHANEIVKKPTTVKVSVNTLISWSDNKLTRRPPHRWYVILGQIVNVKIMAKKKPDSKFTIVNPKLGSSAVVQGDGKGRMVLIR